jgi:hypothetical protein
MHRRVVVRSGGNHRIANVFCLASANRASASLRRSRGSARLKTDIALNLSGQHAGQQPGLNFEDPPIIDSVSE